MNKFINETINQHFISQAEQRLNAINPNAKLHKQKIYSFQIIDREIFKIQLENDNGKLIKNNLSFLDLYSFDVDENSKELRFSLESLFNEYESNIIFYTQTLLNKVNRQDSNILHEAFNIFILKILNSFRNPFCIQKTINTLLPIIKYSPLDKELALIYKKIIDGNKPHYNYLCDFFCVNKGEYELWLKCLFMLLMKVEVNGEKTNALESMARNLYEDKNNYKMIMVCHYDDSYSVLLSDRGFNSIDENENSITEFNLNSSAFITYSFTNLNLFAYSKGWVSNYQKKLIEQIKEIQGNTVYVTYEKNDIDLLNNYNNRTIYQAYSHVFSAKKNWR